MALFKSEIILAAAGEGPFSNTDEQYLNNCVFVKTILMMIVVLYHSSIFWSGAWIDGYEAQFEAPALSVFARWLSTFHVYGFSLVSGYLYKYLRDSANKYQEYKAFIVSKIKRLIVPYCFVTICWVGPITSIICGYSFDEIIKRYLFCANPNQLWFLWMLFDVFLVVWPLNRILKNDFAAIILSIIFFALGVAGDAYFPNIFCIWNACYHFPFFVLGIKLREKSGCFLYRVPSWLYVAVQIVLFGGLTHLSSQTGLQLRILQKAVGLFVNISGALMAFFVLQRIANTINWKESKLMQFLSKRSMTIFLFHQQIIYFTTIIFNGKVNAYINVLLNFFVAIGLSVLISCILERYKCTRFLIGEK